MELLAFSVYQFSSCSRAPWRAAFLVGWRAGPEVCWCALGSQTWNAWVLYPGKEFLDQEQLHWRWFWFSVWCLSSAVCGHRKTPEAWLWDAVIKHRHPGTLTDAHCKPQNIGLLPADLLWGKLLGLKEFILFCTSRASRGQAGGPDAAGALPPFPGAQGSQGGWHGCPGPWDGSLHCLGDGNRGANPQPFHSPARQAGNCWVAPTDPTSSHLKQLFSPLLECALWVLNCMSLELGLASHSGWTLTKSF